MGVVQDWLHRLDVGGKSLFMRLPRRIRTGLAPMAYRIHARIRRLISPNWVGPVTLERQTFLGPLAPTGSVIKSGGQSFRPAVVAKRKVFHEPSIARWLARGGAERKKTALTLAVCCVSATEQDVEHFLDAAHSQTLTAFHLALALPRRLLERVRARLQSAPFAWSVLEADDLGGAPQRFNALIGSADPGMFVFWPDPRFLPGPLFAETALYQLSRTGDDVFFFHVDAVGVGRVPFVTPSAADVIRLGPLSPIVAFADHSTLRLRELDSEAPLLAHAAPDSIKALPAGPAFCNGHSLAITWCDSDYLLSLWDLFARLGTETRYRSLLGRSLVQLSGAVGSAPPGAFEQFYARRHASFHYLVRHEDKAPHEGPLGRSADGAKIAACALSELSVSGSSVRGVLCCLPFRVRGNLTLRLLEEVDRRGAPCFIASQFNASGQYEEDDGPWSRRPDRAFRLSEMDILETEWVDVLRHIIRSRRIGTVLVAGATEVYPMLPLLTVEFPTVRFVDQLFNPVGHTRRHLAFANYFDEVIVENEEMVQFLVDRNVPRERITKIYSGVDLRRFSREAARSVLLKREDLGLEPAVRFVFGYVGRMSWEKDPFGFLEIAKEVLTRVPSAGVLIAGGGPLAQEMAERAREVLPSGRFANLGFVQDVRTALAACDVLVVPSRVDGLPGAIQEANALGVPVVAASVGGIPEMIVDGVTGKLFPPGQNQVAAGLVVQLLADQAALEVMKKQARLHVAKSFSADSMYRTYHAVLTKNKSSGATADQVSTGRSGEGRGARARKKKQA